MTVDVEKEWTEITENMPKPVSEWWWSVIEKKYKEDGREAHDLDCLQRKFQEIDYFRCNLTNVNAFILALFFQ